MYIGCQRFDIFLLPMCIAAVAILLAVVTEKTPEEAFYRPYKGCPALLTVTVAFAYVAFTCLAESL